jgi:DNA polymerase-4
MGPPIEVGRNIKKRVAEKTKLTISIGIAPNRYLAKMASEAGKPNGLFQIKAGEEKTFLDKLPLDKLWGLGHKTFERLKELNINTVPRLRAFSRDILTSMLGEAAGAYLYKIVRGIDPGIYAEEPKSHSVSCERTFGKDTKDLDYIKKILLELSSEIMTRLIAEGLNSRTLFVKIRYQDFKTTSIQKTKSKPVSSTEEAYKLALQLFRKRWDGFTPLRLLGLGAANVSPGEAPDQLELFEQPRDKKKIVETAVNKIKRKMKNIKITRASLLKNKPGQTEK